LDLSRGGFGLGKDSVFEHLGTIAQVVSQYGDYSYSQIEPASYPGSINTPFDRGIFNARVPLLFQGPMRFGVVLNVFAGLTILNPYPLTPGRNNFPFDVMGGGTLHGPINVPQGVSFNLNDPGLSSIDPRKYGNIYTFAADSQVQIEGDLLVQWSSLIVNTNVTAGMLRFVAEKQNSQFRYVDSNTISGPGNIDITRRMSWRSGRIATAGVVTIKPTAYLELEGSDFDAILDGTTLIHQGSSLNSDTGGQITLAGGAVFRNEGTFHRINTYQDILSGIGGGRIENYGEWFFGSANAGFGEMTIDVPFYNNGTFRIENPGNGAADAVRFSSLENNGTLILGAHLFVGRKSVEVRGDYHQSASATLRIELSNEKPLYTQLYSGKLDIAGQAFLAGALEIAFVPLSSQYYTDRPAVGEIYPLLAFASQTGSFSQITDLNPLDGFAYDILTNATSMTTVVKLEPQPLRATSQATDASSIPGPTDTQLAAIFNAAIARWAASGIAIAELNRMRSAVIRVADLDGTLLGLADGNSIQIDRDAAGWGWFIDSSPEDDGEFWALEDQVLQAKPNNDAVHHIDLLTVVLHELGHLAGLQDLDNLVSGHPLMEESLAPSIRKLPA